MFVGRDSYLTRLSHEFGRVRQEQRGRFVLLRGRRRVGKSRLVEEFLRRERPSALYFTASKQSADRELQLFAEALAESDLPASRLVASGTSVGSWEAALNLIAASPVDGEPAVLVIDELPYLLEGDRALEGTLQKVWDRHLQERPILLIVIGSDLSIMEALTEYGRPLYGRPTTVMTVRPFSPLEFSEMLQLPPRDALDAYVVLGGLPFLARSWARGDDIWTFLERELANPSSPLVIDGERILNAEFPTSIHPRRVLTSIGAGETTFAAMGRAAGIQATSLTRALDALIDGKNVVAVDQPLCGKASTSRLKRYRISDPYLRFWLTFVAPSLSEIERERGHIVLQRIRSRWSDYRGRAIEPVIRESVEMMLPDVRLDDALHVGGYWNRTDQEVDLVLSREPTSPTAVVGAGSIKWRERKPFSRGDRDDLARAVALIPGASKKTKLVGVSATGFASTGLDVELGPEDLVKAWGKP
ncbi:MAG TPA: ATP-binding protein [Thermoleophilaceae bacterium]|nr:ATP-binding protein [Thermoleophilaceae bacterium]